MDEFFLEGRKDKTKEKEEMKEKKKEKPNNKNIHILCQGGGGIRIYCNSL